MSAAVDLAAEARRLKAEISLPSMIGRMLPLKRSGRFLAAPCPFHVERTPSFYVYSDHFHCFGCGAHGDLFDWLDLTAGLAFPEAVRLLSGAGPSSLPAAVAFPPPARARPTPADTRGPAANVWREALDPLGSPVETYLRHRGVALPDEPVIRWHPRCPRRDGDVLELLPAMVALMTDPISGDPVGVHRTFLRPDGAGKAAGKAKMMLGNAGVVRLAEPEGEGLGLAEGIETALSAMQAIGWGPVWAACSRGGVETFPVLPGHALTIFADGDQPGQAAARSCAHRWAESGREALIHFAPAGTDWNDIAVRLTA
jgi:hypothetical protein